MENMQKKYYEKRLTKAFSNHSKENIHRELSNVNRRKNKILSSVGNLQLGNIFQQKEKTNSSNVIEDIPVSGTRGNESRHGLPENLQTNLESLSRVDLSDVRIHRNNSEPDRLKAHAFTRGADIYLATGKDNYLAHEAWHVVQQKQGRVQANSSFRGQNINSSPALESEADRMALRATSTSVSMTEKIPSKNKIHRSAVKSVTQLAPNQEGTADPKHLTDLVRRLEAEGLSRSEILDRISEDHAGNSNRYIYTDRHGWVDLRHFGAAGSYAQSTGSVIAEGLGLGNEVVQWLSEWGDDYRSGFSPEDIPSNAAGATFGDDFVNEDELLSDSLDRWLVDAGARTQSDPLSGRSSLPKTDPSLRGGTNRGSSNASRTQSTVSDNEPVNEFVNEWNSGWRALATPEGWYRLLGM